MSSLPERLRFGAKAVPGVGYRRSIYLRGVDGKLEVMNGPSQFELKALANLLDVAGGMPEPIHTVLRKNSFGSDKICVVCGKLLSPLGHTSDCPWARMQKALEALEVRR